MKEKVEIDFLTNANYCRECGNVLTSFMKYTAGTRYLWSGWCDNCQKDRVTIMGNSPDLKRNY